MPWRAGRFSPAHGPTTAAPEEQSAEAVPEEVPAADLLGTADARNRRPAQSLSSRLSVEPEGQSRLIRGSTSTSRRQGGSIANKVVDEYIESAGDQKRGARHAAEWLRNAPGRAWRHRALEQNVERQRQDSGSNLKDIVSQRLGQLNIQLADAQAASVAAGARYEQVRKVLDSHGNLQPPPSSRRRASRRFAQARRADRDAVGTADDLGPKHLSVDHLQAEINEVEGRVNREISTLAGLRNEMESAQIHEAVAQPTSRP